ncbi:DJ-1/PfpI family protein [Simiduia litorea]|uniref:DJ-1/PfpI family protein n=1 Tax=Simiduia litorea TaxID=1435348 RepID=UPI0036F3EFCC
MMTVGIFLFNQVELLDFAGPYEVFTTASRVAQRNQQNPGFKVVTLSKNRNPVIARAGLTLQADYSLKDHPHLDLLLIPGGVVDEPLNDAGFIAWLTSQRAKTKTIGSICTGAFLLAKAGLLDGLDATTHWEDIEQLREHFPAVSVLTNQRFVDHDHTITSAGIAAGIDMSLHLVARLNDTRLAELTAKQMEYPWQPAVRGDEYGL